MSLLPHWQQPSHPHLLEVISPSPPSSPSNVDSSSASSESSFLSFSRSKTTLDKGDVLVTLTGPPLTLAQRAYSSVQVSQDESIELNCDFLYMNHSCDPSLELHVTNIRQHQPESTSDATSTDSACPYAISIRATRNIRPGDELTFFYPSTEWDMAQPFDCQCGAAEGKCLGMVKGARYLAWTDEEVDGRNSKSGRYMNDFIWDLLRDERRK